MRIAILSRNKNLHSIRRLSQEARKLGAQCYVIDPLTLQVVVEGKHPRLLFRGLIVPPFDVILPRIGTSITDYGLAIVRQFEATGTPLVNGSQAILESRDKLLSLQRLAQAGISVPITVLCRGSKQLKSALQSVKEMPVVMKVIRGTQGVGVMLLHSAASVSSVLDTLNTLDEDVLLQQYLKKNPGRDYRVFVVGGRVVAAMMRSAPKGEFRSNIHRGGEGAPVALPAKYRRIAVRAAEIFGLGVAGVDIMDGPNGPTILEVNSSPGFEGIEKATGKNIAALIVKHAIAEARRAHRRASVRKPSQAARAKRAGVRRRKRR